MFIPFLIFLYILYVPKNIYIDLFVSILQLHMLCEFFKQQK